MIKPTDADFELERPEMLWKVLSMIHFRKNPRIEDFPALERYITDEMRRNSSILFVLKSGKMYMFFFIYF